MGRAEELERQQGGGQVVAVHECDGLTREHSAAIALPWLSNIWANWA
jgi:hypothetical protein